METFLKIGCPACAKTLKMKAERAGKRVRCPGCGEVFVAEAARGEVAAPARKFPPPLPRRVPPPLPLSGELEAAATRKPGAAISDDRRMAESLCRILGWIFIACGVLGLFAQIAAVAELSGRVAVRPGAMGVALLQLAISAGLGIAYLAWSGMIRDGAVGVAWLVAIISGIMALIYTGLGGMIIASGMDGGAVAWLLVLMAGALVVMLAKLMYHAIHAVLVSDQLSWQETGETRGFADSVRDFAARVGWRRAMVGTGLGMMLANGLLAGFAGMRLPSSLRSAPKPVAQPAPIGTATEAFDDADIYDARYGLNAAERTELERKWAPNWSPTKAMADRLDAILREDGKQLGNRAPVGPPQGGDQSARHDVRWQSFNGVLEKDAWVSFQEHGRSGWQDPIWRWQCFALQREMDLLKLRVPGATGMQKRAVVDMMMHTPVGPHKKNILRLQGVSWNDDRSMMVQADARTLRVTSDGRVFDDTPSVLQAFEDSQRELAQAAREQFVWRFSPAGLVVDGAVGLLLGLAMVVWTMRMRERRTVPGWLRKRLVTAGVFSVLAWTWFGMACYELGQSWAPRLDAVVIFMVVTIGVARIVQVVLPRLTDPLVAAPLPSDLRAARFVNWR